LAFAPSFDFSFGVVDSIGGVDQYSLVHTGFVVVALWVGHHTTLYIYRIHTYIYTYIHIYEFGRNRFVS
jgi:hypothetical protein